MRALPLIFGALALALVAGCDSTPEAGPSDSGPIIRDVGFPDTGSAPDVVTPTDNGAPVDTGTDVPLVDAGNPTDVPAADVPATDVVDAATTDVPVDVPVDSGASCAGDGGCYACAPSTTAQFLNHCTGASCTPFNNTARLPRLLADGGLPPLP